MYKKQAQVNKHPSDRDNRFFRIGLREEALRLEVSEVLSSLDSLVHGVREGITQQQNEVHKFKQRQMLHNSNAWCLRQPVAECLIPSQRKEK